MKPMTGNRRVILMSLLGAAAGYLFLHPMMVIYEPLGIPFAVLGGVAGLFFGCWPWKPSGSSWSRWPTIF